MRKKTKITSFSHEKSIFEKVKSINLDQIKISIELMKKIEKMDFRPSDFPKKVILIYMRDKMSAEEFYYIYNVWYLKYDDETLRRKFKKIRGSTGNR